MSRSILAWVSLILVAAMTVSALAAGTRLPADLRLPIHWDLTGTPDNFAGKWVALLMPAAFTAALSAFLWFLPLIEPRAHNLARSGGLYLWAWASALLIGVVIQVVVLSTAFDWGLPANDLIVGACGVLFVVIGNQLGKSRSMYLIGLRTPWTLASEEVWVRTHRLAGKLMMLVGLAAILAALLPWPAGMVATVLLAGLVVAVLVPVAYSYWLWRRESRVAAGEDAQSSG